MPTHFIGGLLILFYKKDRKAGVTADISRYRR